MRYPPGYDPLMLSPASRARLLILPLLAALIAGCESTGFKEEPASPSGGSGASSTPAGSRGLVAMARTPVADVPVPIGFKIDDAVSRSYESAGARFVDHTYTGKADKIDTERFYRQQMPNKGWVLRDAQMVRGMYLLSYEKAGEKCDVRISGSETTFGGQLSRVNAIVRTVGRGEPTTPGR
jgi:hypothetical protein